MDTLASSLIFDREKTYWMWSLNGKVEKWLWWRSEIKMVAWYKKKGSAEEFILMSFHQAPLFGWVTALSLHLQLCTTHTLLNLKAYIAWGRKCMQIEDREGWARNIFLTFYKLKLWYREPKTTNWAPLRVCEVNRREKTSPRLSWDFQSITRVATCFITVLHSDHHFERQRGKKGLCRKDLIKMFLYLNN